MIRQLSREIDRLSLIMATPPDSRRVIYLLVRTDLKMGAGKIAAQCGHAIQALTRRLSERQYQTYCQDNSTKICLKVPDLATLEKIAQAVQEEDPEIPLFQVRDAGHTQVPPDTVTCLGIGPVPREQLAHLLGTLKLL